MEYYEIRLQGELDASWSEWFSGLEIVPGEPGETLLRGPVVDQTALHGLLSRVRDLGLALLCVCRVDPSAPVRRGEPPVDSQS